MGQPMTIQGTQSKVVPEVLKAPTFDPMYGFPNGRKARVMHATPEEMESAKIPLNDRDYCVHKLFDYHRCIDEAWPWPVKCAHQKHAYFHCEFEDYVLRMKEFEREKRLLERRERKLKRAQKEEMGE